MKILVSQPLKVIERRRGCLHPIARKSGTQMGAPGLRSTIVSRFCLSRRKMDNQEEVTELTPGISVAIPTGMHFQFRNDGTEPLEISASC